MLAHPASLLGIPLLILDSGDSTPAKQVYQPPRPHQSHPDGAFTSKEHIRQLAKDCDLLTVEIEHVDADVLEQVEVEGLCKVQPSPQTIRLIQDKYLQKLHLQKHGIAVAPFEAVPETDADWNSIVSRLGLPLMLKSRTMAYDGKGNSPLKSLDELSASLTQLGGGDKPLYAEGWATFAKEVAVMVVRNVAGEVQSYDAVETVHKDSILRVCLAPLRDASGKDVNARAKELAEAAVATLDGAGIFGVEMFLMQDGSLVVNEIAPRPHNSGHHTIEACETSQFENHLRAILSLPLGSTSLRVPSAAMLNLIGTSSEMSPIDKACEIAMSISGATVHLYGKTECRKGRKMGHITVTGESDAEVQERMRPILETMDDLSSEWIHGVAPPKPAPAHSHSHPLVGIIMGSDSDLPTMLPAARMLDQFDIPYELTIISAHRTPGRMVEYAHSAQKRGLRCIIAGAGGAAHLPGMVASETTLPVIGVPVKASVLDGVDSLYSIVQMPRGIPVATVGIANSTNAGLLAARILGATNSVLNAELARYAAGLETEVLGKVDKLADLGWEEYATKVLNK